MSLKNNCLLLLVLLSFDTLQAEPRIQDMSAGEASTALIVAAQKSWLVHTKELLKVSDIDVDITDQLGATPLIYASATALDSSLISTLIDAGADVNKADNSGRTPLIMACLSAIDSAPLNLKKLINAPNINFNHKDFRGKSALFYAAERSKKDRFLMLLNTLGVDINLANSDGNTPLMYVTQGSWLAGVHALLAQPDIQINTVNKKGEGVLFLAVDSLIFAENIAEYLALIRTLVRAGSQDIQGQAMAHAQKTNNLSEELRTQVIAALQNNSVLKQRSLRTSYRAKKVNAHPE